jgi:hypothetical protein
MQPCHSHAGTDSLWGYLPVKWQEEGRRVLNMLVDKRSTSRNVVQKVFATVKWSMGRCTCYTVRLRYSSRITKIAGFWRESRHLTVFTRPGMYVLQYQRDTLSTMKVEQICYSCIVIYRYAVETMLLPSRLAIYCHVQRVCAWLIDGLWSGWLDLLTL